MTNFGLITWEDCISHLEVVAKNKSRDKELTELQKFSSSAEIEILKFIFYSSISCEICFSSATLRLLIETHISQERAGDCFYCFP
jgi:hypothetical protein